jgi:hypothetical protein
MQNKKKYWFKRRQFGLGWSPASKEGLYVVVGYFAFITITGFLSTFLARYINFMPTVYFWLFIISSLVFIGICFVTGEPLFRKRANNE